MRDKTEIRGRIFVTESRDTGCKLHHSGNHTTCIIAQTPVFHHHILAVFYHSHMDVETRTGFTCRNLWCESYVETVAISQIADDPFGNHQLIGRFLNFYGQEFDFILLINETVQCECSYFGMTVFDLTACTGDMLHTHCAEFVCLYIRSRLVISVLVNSREYAFVGLDNIVLQLAHSLVFHSRCFGKGLCGLIKCVFGRTLQGVPVFVEERTKQVKCRYLGKWIYESRAETR